PSSTATATLSAPGSAGSLPARSPSARPSSSPRPPPTSLRSKLLRASSRRLLACPPRSSGTLEVARVKRGQEGHNFRLPPDLSGVAFSSQTPALGDRSSH